MPARSTRTDDMPDDTAAPRRRPRHAPLTRRQLAGHAALAGGLAAPLAGACGLGGGTTPAAPPAGALRTGVTLTLANFYGTVQQDNIRRRVALFQQDTPGIQVGAVQFQGGAAYREKLLAMFAADAPPDAMQMSAA